MHKLLVVSQIVIFALVTAVGYVEWLNSSQATQNCIDTLPYGYTRIQSTEYYKWYGKVGENINGTEYLTGHVFTRHIAVGGKCTSDQIKQKKTVFASIQDFYKTLAKDKTLCTLSSEKAFNFNQNHEIAAPSDYIHGIDCITGKTEYFKKYFAEFKRAIQNPQPSQQQYMTSQHTTLWTFYPKR